MNPTGWIETLGVSPAWRFGALSVGAMVVLAGLDMTGAILAKEWTLRQHPGWFLAGLLTFGVLFAVYAASLHIAELSIVTLGWIVFLQIGLMVTDTMRYGVSFPAEKWLAIVVMLLLQAFLVLGPNGNAAS